MNFDFNMIAKDFIDQRSSKRQPFVGSPDDCSSHKLTRGVLEISNSDPTAGLFQPKNSTRQLTQNKKKELTKYEVLQSQLKSHPTNEIVRSLSARECWMWWTLVIE